MRGEGSLMTHSAGCVITQRIAFKYVITSEPYRYTWYLKQVMTSLPYIKSKNNIADVTSDFCTQRMPTYDARRKINIFFPIDRSLE